MRSSIARTLAMTLCRYGRVVLFGLVLSVLSVMSPAALHAETAAPRPNTQVMQGLVFPVKALDIPAEIPGIVTLKVELGQVVKSGEVLATLEHPTLVFDVARARASKASAEAEAEAAATRLTQAENLLARRNQSETSWSREEMESARFNKDLASADLKLAEAAVAHAAADLAELEARQEKSLVRAPFSGVVTRMFRNDGENIGTDDLLLRLIDDKVLCIRFGVPGSLSPGLGPGSRLKARFTNPEASCVVELLRLGPETDPATGLAVAEAGFMPQDVPSGLWPGAGVELTVVPEE